VATKELAKATVLLFAGRDTEAEPMLRACLENPVSTKRERRTATGHLATILTDQSRYQEAEGLLKTSSLQGGGAEGSVYVAEIMLRRNDRPEEILQLLDRSNSAEPSGRLEAHMVASIEAARGLALLRLDRPADADRALDRALAIIDDHFRPGAARVLYRVSMVLREAGRHAEAIQSFERCHAMDPPGKYGALSEFALQQMRV